MAQAKRLHPESLQSIVCCMGQPVAGNPTQFMMERAFSAAGLDWRYLTLEVSPENLEAAVQGMRAMGFKGANFTLPHKVCVIPLLDGLSPAAEKMGAVNCVQRVEGKLIGENTDGKGFVQSLRELVDPAGKSVVVLGAGGAARAIAVELALSGVTEFTIVNRSVPRGQELADLLTQRLGASRVDQVHWQGEYTLAATANIVINATSIGLNDGNARVPVVVSSWRPEMIAADVVFNPPDTRFLREAAQAGCKTLDGLGMLVNQAVIGFRIWTGIEPDAALMRDALEEFLSV